MEIFFNVMKVFTVTSIESIV